MAGRRPAVPACAISVRLPNGHAGGVLERPADGDEPPLSLVTTVRDECLHLAWNYRAESYREATVQRLAERVLTRLKRLASQCSVPVA